MRGRQRFGHPFRQQLGEKANRKTQALPGRRSPAAAPRAAPAAAAPEDSRAPPHVPLYCRSKHPAHLALSPSRTAPPAPTAENCPQPTQTKNQQQDGIGRKGGNHRIQKSCALSRCGKEATQLGQNCLRILPASWQPTSAPNKNTHPSNRFNLFFPSSCRT